MTNAFYSSGSELTPANMTFLYGTAIVVLLYAPLGLVLACAVDRTFKESETNEYDPVQPPTSRLHCLKVALRFLGRHWAVMLLFLLQSYHGFVQARTYGFLSAVGPIGFGFPALTGLLYYRAVTLPAEAFAEVKVIWGREEA